MGIHQVDQVPVVQVIHLDHGLQWHYQVLEYGFDAYSPDSKVEVGHAEI
jgi:hypothetical protein